MDITKYLPQALTIGMVGMVFAAGVAWNRLDSRVEASDEKIVHTTRAVEELQVDVSQAKHAIKRLEENQQKTDWMTYQILKQVNPNAAAMVPMPRQPTEN